MDYLILHPLRKAFKCFYKSFKINMQHKIRISYYLSHPIQYFSPLLREMAKSLQLQVYYFSDISIRGGMDKGFGQNIKWDIPLLEGYNSSFIKNYSKSPSLDNHFWDLINPGVVKKLFNDPSSIIIMNGWSYCTSLIAIFFARLMGKKIWLRIENPYSKEIRKRKHFLWLKKLLLKHLLFRFFIDKYLYIGKDSKDFFKLYGVPDNRLIYTPYCVDNEYFHNAWLQYREKKTQLLQELNLPADRIIILFTGKYQPVKRPIDLIKAYALLQSFNIALVMVGEGELRGDMETYIKDNKLQHIYLTGFVNQSQISRYYAIADMLVLCSESETWGLSVNEAMNFELPVVVSDTVGCSHDLVEQGKNGFIFEKGNVQQLAGCLKQLIRNDSFRKEAGKLSLSIVQQYNTGVIIENVKIAAEEEEK